jgi:predicted metal-dependent hydrolase
LTGPGFQEWSDRLRDIEELVSDPKLKSDVTRIREEARKVRVEFKRHSKEPEWDLVRTKILEPLNTVEQRLHEEIIKRESPDSLVPIDRDPVPEEFSELVRRYYERIGAGR